MVAEFKFPKSNPGDHQPEQFDPFTARAATEAASDLAEPWGLFGFARLPPAVKAPIIQNMGSALALGGALNLGGKDFTVLAKEHVKFRPFVTAFWN